MDMIQFIQKARQLKVLGFDSYQGIVATHGIEKADEILSYLLEASELGFNLSDLKSLFNNLSVKKEETQQEKPSSIDKEGDQAQEASKVDLWQLVKERFEIDNFDIEQFVYSYSNPSYPNSLEIEDFLMCLGVDWVNANKKIRYGSAFIQVHLLNKGFKRNEVSTITTLSPSFRQVYPKTKESVSVLLEALSKFLLKDYVPNSPSFKNLNDWLNAKFTIERNGVVEQWFLPGDTYVDLSAKINSLLIQYGIGEKYLLKSYLSSDDFTPADALDVSRGFCEIVYRDAVMTLYNKDMSFRDVVQEFCNKKGIVYTKDFEDRILSDAGTIKVNQFDFKNFTVRSVRPFHQLILLHLMEKVTDEKTKLKIEPLFS